MSTITYRPHGCNYIIQEDSSRPGWQKWVEVYKPYPIIGEKYMVVYYCDYDNSEYGENYIVEITKENIHEVSFRMNDTHNDITDYVLIEQ